MKKFSTEVLVSSLNKDTSKLYKNMNISSNAVIVNQSNETKERIETYNGKTIKIYDYNERGIGKSRNKGLMSIESDICLIADDDLIYIDTYEEEVLKAFEEIPQADIIIFDIILTNVNKKITKKRPIKKIKKLHSFNSMRYGACRFAIKMESLRKNNIWFSLLFGGGAKYGAGEDSLFLRDCFRKKMKVYSYPKVIAYVDESESSWYTGMNKKYLKDKGAFLALAYPRICKILAFYYALRLKNVYKDNFGIKECYENIKEGIYEII